MSAQPNVIRVGEWMVDETTGEIVDIATPHEESPFLVHDQDSAEWVMERLFDAEANIAAVQARRKVLMENLDAVEKVYTRRAEWLRWRFGSELEEWASDHLEETKSKARSIKTPFGTLSFRRKPAKRVVTDEDAAIEVLEVACPDAVKVTKNVLVSMLPDEVIVPGIEEVPAEDGFRIVTGLL